MQTWRVELTAGGKILAEVKILRGILQGDTLSLLQFVIAMMTLNIILRKCTARQKLSKSQEKINHDVHERHKTFCQKRKRIGNPNTNYENIVKIKEWNLE